MTALENMQCDLEVAGTVRQDALLQSAWTELHDADAFCPCAADVGLHDHRRRLTWAEMHLSW